MRKTQLAFLLIVINLLAACKPFNKDEFIVKKVTGTPSFYIPVAFGNMSVQSALKSVKDAEIKIKSDGLLYLYYTQAKRSSQASILFELPQTQTVSASTPVPAGNLPVNGTEKRGTPVSNNAAFNFAPKKLTEVKFKSTTLSITLNMVPNSGVYDIELRFPGCTKDGLAFTHRQAPSATPVQVSLVDYVMALTDNSFSYEITLIEKSHTQQVNVQAGQVNVRIDFASIDFKYLKGFLGASTIPLPNLQYEFDVLSGNFKDIEMSIADPKVDIHIYNGFGAPAQISFPLLEVEDGKGKKTALQTAPASPASLNQPADLGQPRNITEMIVTNSKAALNKKPRYLRINAFSEMNKGQTTGRNFCADTSTVGWRYHLEIPFYGHAGKIYIRDTVDINLTDVKIDEVQDAELAVTATNQLPADAYTQLYLADAKAVIYDSLLIEDNLIVKSSEVNDKGELAKAVTTDKKIKIDNARLKKIVDAKKLIIKAGINTGNQPADVKFKSDQKINIQIGLSATLKPSITITP